MSGFKANHRIDLAFVGDGWDGAYVDIVIPSYAEVEEIDQLRVAGDQLAVAGAMMDYIKDHFVEGKAPQDGKLVDLSADDLKQLPIHAVKKITGVVNGEDILDPKF